jgi:hypothetical protein
MIAEVYNEKTRLDPSHELWHIVLGRIGDPPALFNEGLATYMQEGHVWEGRPVDVTARALLDAGKLVSLSGLLARDEIGSRRDDGEVAYPQAASFVGFLIETYGREKFLVSCRKLKNGDDDERFKANAAAIREIYGQGLEDLEKQWRDGLARGRSGTGAP